MSDPATQSSQPGSVAMQEVISTLAKLGWSGTSCRVTEIAYKASPPAYKVELTSRQGTWHHVFGPVSANAVDVAWSVGFLIGLLRLSETPSIATCGVLNREGWRQSNG